MPALGGSDERLRACREDPESDRLPIPQQFIDEIALLTEHLFPAFRHRLVASQGLWAGHTHRGPATVVTNPEKIAVFDLAALDSLEAIGVKPAGVVRPVYLDMLENAAEGAVTVGSLFEPDFEAVNTLQPDLIIAGGRSAEVVPDLAKLAPTIDMTIWQDTIGEGLDRLMAYGAIFGGAPPPSTWA